MPKGIRETVKKLVKTLSVSKGRGKRNTNVENYENNQIPRETDRTQIFSSMTTFAEIGYVFGFSVHHLIVVY